MLEKLFGGKSKKKNGFYLELKEDITDSVNNIVPAVKEVVEEKVSAVKEVVEEKVSAVKESADEKKTENKPTSTKVVEEKKTKTPTKKKAVKKTSVKSKEKQPTETNTNNGQVSQATSSASSSEPPTWVKAMYNTNGKKTETETTFATDNLMPLPNKSRRRPGPSLNMFKDMARQAKTPRF